jgi:spore coat polysaccharide biosynthesis predicted glycosyltransferase SpsG
MRAMFWADCGTGAGLGHVSRTAAVAGAWRAAGHDAVIVLPERRGDDLIAGEGVDPARVDTFDAFVAQSARDAADLVVVDSYRLPPSAGPALRQAGATVAAFDDDGGDALLADVVINGAPGAVVRNGHRRGGASYVVGPEFFPLRRALAASRGDRVIAGAVATVVATAGGEDVHGLLRLMVEAALDAFAAARVFAAAVPGARLDGLPPRVEVGPAGAALAARLRDADVAVCGGGQTLVEAAALGTPAAAVLLGDDQRLQRAAVLAAGAAVDGGEWRQPAGAMRDALAGRLKAMAPEAVRRAMSAAGQALVDGRGAARIAAALAAAAGRKS